MPIFTLPSPEELYSNIGRKNSNQLPALGEASTLSSQTWICDKYTGFQPTLAQFHIIKGCRLERYITLFRVKVSRITSVDCIILWLLIWLVNIGRPSVKPWCYWLWRLVISNWCVSIRLLSQLNSPLLLVKLSVLQSFWRTGTTGEELK